jgi:hypothetical protein
VVLQRSQQRRLGNTGDAENVANPGDHGQALPLHACRFMRSASQPPTQQGLSSEGLAVLIPRASTMSAVLRSLGLLALVAMTVHCGAETRPREESLAVASPVMAGVLLGSPDAAVVRLIVRANVSAPSRGEGSSAGTAR